MGCRKKLFSASMKKSLIWRTAENSRNNTWKIWQAFTGYRWRGSGSIHFCFLVKYKHDYLPLQRKSRRPLLNHSCSSGQRRFQNSRVRWNLTPTLHKYLVQKRFSQSISGHQETIARFQDLTVCLIRFRLWKCSIAPCWPNLYSFELKFYATLG